MSNAATEAFADQGYTIVRGLFSSAEAAAYVDHYMDLRQAGTYPLDHAGVDTDDEDPIRSFPRMTHMQRWDRTSREWLLHPRLAGWLTQLLGEVPLAVQSMLYFKPPGSRGQAMHQDQFYLKARPGTCIAAWMALDRCDDDNGCLQVVPGSHRLPILCTQRADTRASFTDVTVPVPDALEPVSLCMDPGDVAFFGGALIHGSPPNRTADRFRRALAGHYVSSDAVGVAAYYHPILGMDGREVTLATSQGGGPCGVWVDRDGRPEVEMQPRGTWQADVQGIAAD